MFAVLFDLEGTLVRSIENDEKGIRSFRKETRKKLLKLGMPGSELKGVISATLM